MSRVILNKVGTDIVDLQVTQTGNNETTVILKDALLLGNKDYHFAVTELSVPLVEAPIFGWVKQDTELFQIQRRNLGVEFTAGTLFGETHIHYATLQGEIDNHMWEDDGFGQPAPGQGALILVWQQVLGINIDDQLYQTSAQKLAFIQQSIKEQHTVLHHLCQIPPIKYYHIVNFMILWNL